jgi:hypothetical protein
MVPYAHWNLERLRYYFHFEQAHDGSLFLVDSTEPIPAPPFSDQ